MKNLEGNKHKDQFFFPEVKAAATLKDTEITCLFFPRFLGVLGIWPEFTFYN